MHIDSSHLVIGHERCHKQISQLVFCSRLHDQLHGGHDLRCQTDLQVSLQKEDLQKVDGATPNI